MDNPEVTPAAPGTAAPSAPGGAAAAAAAPAAPAGTQGAIDAARQRLEEGKPLVPEPPPGGAAGEGAAGGEDAAAGGDKVEGDGKPAAGAEGEGAAAPDGAAAAEETPFTVTLQGMELKGEQPIELEAPDEETFNRLNRLQNEATLGRQVKDERRGIQQQRAELSEVEDMIAIDPTGFVMEHVPEKVRIDIAMQMFFEPGVLEAVQANLAERLKDTGFEGGLAEILGDPNALRTLRAELKTSRLELKEQLRAQNEERKAMTANAERVAGEIDRLIPVAITGEKRELLFRDALRDVKERCQRLGLKQIDPQDVQLIVSDRFRRQGIDLTAAGNGDAGKGPAPAGAAAAPKGRTAEEFQQARDVRRAAAATAPAGAGAPAAKPRPDLPKTTAERIKLARKVGLRSLLGLS
jgi:hypothetical protein